MFYQSVFCYSDATSNGEATVHLENRLRNLSSGLVGLRNCLHDQASGGTTEAAIMLPPATFVSSNYYQGKSDFFYTLLGGLRLELLHFSAWFLLKYS